MRESRVVLDNLEVPSSRFDTAIEWLLISLLAFMPFAFGVVHAWSEEIVIALSGGIVVFFLLKLVFHPGQGLIWTWGYVPVGLFFLIAMLQLVSLPTWLVNIISPNTVAVRKELLGDLPNAHILLKSMPLSFYPYATKHDLRLLLAVAGVFVVVLNVFRRPDQIKRLLIAIAVIGGFIALLTLAQNLFGNSKIYWFISSKNSKGYSGPFVNHSNYGQFMNLSIGAAFGLLMVKICEAFIDRKITMPVIFEYLSSGSAKLLWLLVAIMGIGTATVFLSLSRGGMVSMLIAIIFTALLIASKRSIKSHSWIMVVMALIAFTCVLYIGFDAVYYRLATLRDFHEAEAGRMQILKDIAVAWTKFPVFGTGLGTHSVVYPMFDRSTITELAEHAENEYAQVAEEMGLIGLGVLIIFGLIVWSNYLRNVRNTNLPICLAAYGLGFGILAILIHSLSDFGQHLPANAVLSAIFCALMLGLAQQRERKRILNSGHRMSSTKSPEGNFEIRHSRFVARPIVLLVVSGIWIWALIGANNFRIAEAHWAKAIDIEKNLVDRDWQGTDAEYADLISNAEMALDYQPENVRYRHWLSVYRWRSISRTADPNIREPVISENSTPMVLNIIDELHRACTLCPTYGPSYSLVGQIKKFILKDDSGGEGIRKGYRLAPCDPIACFVAGYLDVSEGKTEDSIEKFDRAVQLDGSLFRDVSYIYINHLSRPHLAVLSAGDDIGRLSYVVNVLEDMQYHDLAEQTREKIKDLLETKCSQPDAPASALVSLANIYRKEQDNEAAIEYYRHALVLDYGQVYWRLDMARLLAEMERIPEAIHEARICLRLRPQLKAAEKLIADLSVHPSALGQEIESP